LAYCPNNKFYASFQSNSLQACRRACTIESEFLCRSYLYTGSPTGTDYNCKLYHLDHWTLADGMASFLNSNTPLNIPNGNRIGSYYENRCERKSIFSPLRSIYAGDKNGRVFASRSYFELLFLSESNFKQSIKIISK
jgi:hypothetical protein